MESLPSHMRLISAMFFNIIKFRYADDTKDEYEAQWYEPWDAILNWLRLITDWGLTVAPQPRLVRLVNAQYAGSDGDIDARSLDVHRGSDGPAEKETPLNRAAQIPDFGLYYNTLDDNIKRRLPLIVEIKPYGTPFGSENALDICTNMIAQTLVQARHVFECYGYNHRPGCKILHVLCIAGKHFFMYKINMKDLDLLPEDTTSKNKNAPLARERLDFVKAFMRKVKVAEVQNKNGTDYSTAFKQAWTKFIRDCELGLSAPRWPVV